MVMSASTDSAFAGFGFSCSDRRDTDVLEHLL